MLSIGVEADVRAAGEGAPLGNWQPPSRVCVQAVC